MRIEDALRQLGYEVIDRQQPGEIAVNCPFCVGRGYTQDTRYRLSINTHKGWAHCFNCSFSSRSFDKLIAKAGFRIRVSREDQSEVKERTISPVKLPKEYEPLDRYNRKTAVFGPFVRYLLDRGITKRQIRRHKIGCCLTGKYAYRVIFPILYRREVVAWAGRSLHPDTTPKYLNSSGTLLPMYNGDAIRAGSTVVVVEGIIKLLVASNAAAHLPYVFVASLSNTLSSIQRKQLKRAGKLILFPDPDVPGLEGYLKVADEFEDTAYFPVELPRKQADELSAKALTSSLRVLQPYSKCRTRLRLELARRRRS